MKDIVILILVIILIVIIIKNLGMDLSCNCDLKRSKRQNFVLPGTYEVPTDKVTEYDELGYRQQSSGFPNFQARDWGVVVRTPQGGPTNTGPIMMKEKFQTPETAYSSETKLGGTKGSIPNGKSIYSDNLVDRESFEIPGTYEVPPPQPNSYTKLGSRDTAAGLSGLGVRAESFQFPGTYEVPPSQPNVYATLGREEFALTRGFQSITSPYITDLNDQTTTYARVEQTRAKPVGQVYNDCYEYCVTNGDRPSVLYNFKNTAECAEKCFEGKVNM